MMAVMGLIITACTQATDQNAEANVADTPPAPVEIGDNKHIAMAQEGLQAMTNQDTEAFVARFTDDAMYIFNTGDTISGKAAITEFWQGRMEVIETIEFSNDLWLPLQVNESEDVALGKWLLAWFQVDASYTSGGQMSQYIHTSYHFTENDEIDVVLQYLDRLSIMQAEGAQE